MAKWNPTNVADQQAPKYEETDINFGDSDGDDDQTDQTHKSSPRENYDDDELAGEFKKYAKGPDHQLRDVLKQFFIRPEMRAMFKSLSTIYRDKPDECPNEIRLIVLTYEFIEFVLDFESTDTGSLEAFNDFLRKRWGNIGPFVNLGGVPNGKQIHVLLAFATKMCMGNTEGDDEVDLMPKLNHTLKYMLRNILLDFFLRMGINVKGEDVEKFFLDNFTRSDGCVFCGQTGKGNKQTDYLKETNAHFDEFCKRFKDQLKIPDGGMSIDGKEYTHYEGFHFVSGVGILDIVQRAILTKAKTGKPLHLLVHSLRIRRLFFVIENDMHVFDVLENDWLIICPFVHPNYHQCYLTCIPEDEIEKLDISYSKAFEPIKGKEIKGNIIEFAQPVADSSQERYKMRVEAKIENKEGREKVIELMAIAKKARQKNNVLERILKFAKKRKDK